MSTKLKTMEEVVVDIAMDQIGVKESPPNSNNVRYNTWYYGHEVSGKEYPWCMVFCQWVYSMAGVRLPVLTASCGEMMRYAKQKGRWIESGYRKGDLILFDWTESKKSPSHCGILYSIDERYGRIQTIEGNTSLTNQSNGGEVMLRGRRVSQVRGAVRPEFRKELTVDEFIEKLSPEQAYKILQKAQEYAATLPEPKWAVEQEVMSRIKKTGIMNDGKPEGLVKRDELAVSLLRLLEK